MPAIIPPLSCFVPSGGHGEKRPVLRKSAEFSKVFLISLEAWKNRDEVNGSIVKIGQEVEFFVLDADVNRIVSDSDGAEKFRDKVSVDGVVVKRKIF